MKPGNIKPKIMDVRVKGRPGSRGMAQPKPDEWRNLKWYISVMDIGKVNMDGETHVDTAYHCPPYMRKEFEPEVSGVIAEAKKFISQDNLLPQWAGGLPNSLNY